MSRNLRRASALAIPALALALLPFTGMTADAAQPGKAVAARAAAPDDGSLWTPTSAKPQASLNGHKRTVNPSDYKGYTLNTRRARPTFSPAAPHRGQQGGAPRRRRHVSIPAPDRRADRLRRGRVAR